MQIKRFEGTILILKQIMICFNIEGITYINNTSAKQMLEKAHNSKLTVSRVNSHNQYKDKYLKYLGIFVYQ